MNNKIDLSNYEIYINNKSKFISYLFKIDDIKQVDDILTAIKSEHKKATHVCYAYYFKDPNNQIHVKAFDDNEPKRTSGYIILKTLEQNKLEQHLLVVVRYFGISKLGKSNLLRSYLKASINIINKSITNK